MSIGGKGMSDLVREHTTDAFVLLKGTLSTSEARKQLAQGSYGVVLDKQDDPIALIVAEDLEQAASCDVASLFDFETGLSPVVVVGSEIQMQELVESGAMTMFDIGARGAVVLGDEGVVGVLLVETIDDYLGGGEYKLPAQEMGPSAVSGDADLGGGHQTPLGRVLCTALVDSERCNYINKVAFLDEDHMPTCQNPGLPSHTLQVAHRE
jgi:hypothetical protein